MDLWDGEDWYLQLDSHHGFVSGWDTALLQQASATESPRPVLSTFGAPFSPDSEERTPGRATRIEFGSFTEEGDVLARAGWLTGDSTRPVRARFASGHFLFAPGSFVEAVPYDPDLYFLGEETALAVRAFTHGYDLFHPGVPILSHEYTRANRPKHWDDHVRSNGIAIAWHERDAVSRAKIRRLLHEPSIGQYELGAERTLADYEAYAGVSFRERRIQDYTLRHLEPPNPPEGAWIEQVAAGPHQAARAGA
jgi:hypothetical protein